MTPKHQAELLYHFETIYRVHDMMNREKRNAMMRLKRKETADNERRIKEGSSIING